MRIHSCMWNFGLAIFYVKLSKLNLVPLLALCVDRDSPRRKPLALVLFEMRPTPTPNPIKPSEFLCTSNCVGCSCKPGLQKSANAYCYHSLPECFIGLNKLLVMLYPIVKNVQSISNSDKWLICCFTSWLILGKTVSCWLVVDACKHDYVGQIRCE